MRVDAPVWAEDDTSVPEEGASSASVRPRAAEVPGSDSKLARRVGVLGIASIAFFTICGGPNGIEAAVQAGGPLVYLIGILAMSILWSFPQALITGVCMWPDMVRERLGESKWGILPC